MDRLKNLDWTSKNKHMHGETYEKKAILIFFFFLSSDACRSPEDKVLMYMSQTSIAEWL